MKIGKLYRCKNEFYFNSFPDTVPVNDIVLLLDYKKVHYGIQNAEEADGIQDEESIEFLHGNEIRRAKFYGHNGWAGYYLEEIETKC